MNKNRKYEFGLASKTEKAKIILARIIVFSVMLACLLAALFETDSDLSSRLYNAGVVAVSIFVYVNLLNINLEFAEVLEWTFDHQGVEFAILGGLFSTYAFYLDNFA